MLPQPGFLLLLWCGVVATIVARPIARHTTATTRRARIMGLITDLLVFPVIYAVVFELAGHADLAGGAIVGASHGAMELGFSIVQPLPVSHDVRIRAFLARTLYGMVFAFVYIVPAA